LVGEDPPGAIQQGGSTWNERSQKKRETLFPGQRKNKLKTKHARAEKSSAPLLKERNTREGERKRTSLITTGGETNKKKKISQKKG